MRHRSLLTVFGCLAVVLALCAAESDPFTAAQRNFWSFSR